MTLKVLAIKCPKMTMFDLVPMILGSLLNHQVSRTGITSRPTSNSGRIELLALELPIHECLNVSP